MGRVEQIETAIDGLPPEEYRRIVQWFRVREQRRWDDQLDSDSSADKLDFLFDEAESESAKGLLREWPPQALYLSLPAGSGNCSRHCHLKFKISPSRTIVCGDGILVTPRSVSGVCREAKIASASGSEITIAPSAGGRARR